MKVDGESYSQALTSESVHYKSVPSGLCTVLLLLNRLKFMQLFIFPSNPAGKSPLQLHLIPKRHLCMECSFKKLLYVLFILAVWSTAHIWFMKSSHSLKSLILAYIKKWHVSNSPAAFITRYASKLYDIWTSSVAEKSQFNLQKPLISREQRTRLISVNFSPQVRLLLSSHTYVNVYVFPYRTWLSSRPVAGVSAAGGEVPRGQRGWSHSRYGCRRLFQQRAAVAVCGQSGARNQLVQQSDEHRARGGDAADPEPADRHWRQVQRSWGEPLLDEPR